jgi:hypothetical protein
VHDLVSGTRVVVGAGAARLTSRGTAAGEAVPAGPRISTIRVGPFDVGAGVTSSDGTMLAEGFDPVLRRRVWIHVVTPETPALDPVRRDVARPGRLRWLTGRRDGRERWDAFEAPDGQPLDALPRGSIAWRSAKTWLVDLAAELQASAAEKSLPVLALDRVWVRADDRAVLLDFPVRMADRSPASAGTPAASAPIADPVTFLSVVMARVDDGLAREPRQRGPAGAPLSALTLMREWAAGRLPASLADAHAVLTRAAAAPDEVPRMRRAVPVALAALPVALAMAAAMAIAPVCRLIGSLSLYEITQLLPKVVAADEGRADAAAVEHARAIEVYLAGRYSRELTDPVLWNNRGMRSLAALRRTASRIVADHPAVTPEDLARARARLAPDLAKIAGEFQSQGPALAQAERTASAALLALGMALGLVASLISALAVPGGLLARLLGLAVVDANDREIGRLRSAVRVLVAWSPFIAMVLLLGSDPLGRLQASPVSPLVIVGIPIAILAAGAAWTIARPARGLHDLVAGTRTVNR